MEMTRLEETQARVNSLLNYGGITLEDGRLVLDTSQGDLASEIKHMNQLCYAFADLAAALNGEGFVCAECMPTEADANEHGDVEWLRSGMWMRGRVSSGKPVDATRWRPMV